MWKQATKTKSVRRARLRTVEMIEDGWRRLTTWKYFLHTGFDDYPYWDIDTRDATPPAVAYHFDGETSKDECDEIARKWDKQAKGLFYYGVPFTTVGNHTWPRLEEDGRIKGHFAFSTHEERADFIIQFGGQCIN
jgi:hypothetical protein